MHLKNGITRAYLICDGIEINADNYLISVDFSDEKADPEDGRFIGKAICRSIDIKLNNRANVLNLENKEVEYHLGAKVDGNFVYINFGKFIVQKPENQEVKEETTFQALDYMSKFDIKYIPGISFPNTILNIAKDVCKQCGVELGNTNFKNADKVIDANPFINAEQCREVIKSIAKISFSCGHVWQDNKLYFGFDVIEDDVTEEISIDDYFETEKNNEINPITIITLRSGELPTLGQSIRNEELINKYGENELIIEENYFSYTDALRQEFLKEASFLFGLTYNPINVDLEGSVYLSFNDVIKIVNLNSEEIKTYCLNNYHTYNGTLYNNISVPALTEVEEKYNYQNEEKNQRTKTAVEIDKANAKITQVVEQVGEHESVLVQHTQSIEGLEQKVSKVGAYKSETSGVTQIHLTEAGALNVVELEIRGNKTYINDLFPGEDLYPEEDLYPNQEGGV